MEVISLKNTHTSNLLDCSIGKSLRQTSECFKTVPTCHKTINLAISTVLNVLTIIPLYNFVKNI